MFSLAAAGKLWSRHASSYNLMSASALIQVWFDPLLPTQPGFLLSYAAVFGILFLHPRLFSLYWLKNKWLDKAWELSSLSIAAQWFTLPLVLFFFHKFPVYWWCPYLPPH
jgi:competence protein ComEC